MQQRRTFLSHTGHWLLGAAALHGLAGPAGAQARQRVAIAVPGPGNLLFLPITLAGKLGMDRAEALSWTSATWEGGRRPIATCWSAMPILPREVWLP